jgi:putative methionine-R-sulfoxide reductase with GAF domain
MLPNDLTLLLDKLLPRVEKAKLIAEAIRAAGTYRWVGLHDVDNERGLVSNIAWSGSGAPEYPVFPITKGLNSRAIAAKRTVNVGDVASDAAYLTALPTTQSEIIIPVLSATGDKVVRTIIAESERPDAFDAHTQTSLEECANALRPFWQHEKSSAAFTIRRATIDDSEGILECLASAFAAFRESYTPEGFLDTVLSAETVQQRLQDMDIFVAVRTDGTVIGTIACKVEHEGEGHLRGMAVSPECKVRALLRNCSPVLRTSFGMRAAQQSHSTLRSHSGGLYGFTKNRVFSPQDESAIFFGMPLFEYRKYVENND